MGKVLYYFEPPPVGTEMQFQTLFLSGLRPSIFEELVEGVVPPEYPLENESRILGPDPKCMLQPSVTQLDAVFNDLQILYLLRRCCRRSAMIYLRYCRSAEGHSFGRLMTSDLPLGLVKCLDRFSVPPASHNP